AGDVHRLCERLSGQAPAKLAAFADVGDRVFPANAGKTDDRRLVAECVEEAVGRQIDDTTGRHAGNPPDRARADDGAEGVVGEKRAMFARSEIVTCGQDSYLII